MSNKLQRWKLAQRYESNWWRDNIHYLSTEYYAKTAEDIRVLFNRFDNLSSSTHILEVGTGACGILSFLYESSVRYGIDPLEDYYAGIAKVQEIRQPGVQYLAAKGEDIPFNDEMFDLIIVDNVLDHCESPEAVMREIKRVLKSGGKLYFRQNTYTLYGKLVRWLMEQLLIDKGHPFTFRKKELAYIFANMKLRVVYYNRNGYWTTWKKEIQSKSLKDKIKALLLVTRDKTEYFLISE